MAAITPAQLLAAFVDFRGALADLEGFLRDGLASVRAGKQPEDIEADLALCVESTAVARVVFDDVITLLKGGGAPDAQRQAEGRQEADAAPSEGADAVPTADVVRE